MNARPAARRPLGWATLGIGLMLLATSCTVQRAGTACVTVAPAKGSKTPAVAAAPEVPAQGVTAKQITLSLLAVDLSTLVKQHLAPDIGSPGKVAQAVVDDINAHGGVNGRQVVLKVHTLDYSSALLNPSGAQSYCIAATEQDKPLAAVVAAALPSSLVQCVSVSHPVVSVTMNQWDDALYRSAAGRVFSCCAGSSIGMNRIYAAWPSLLQKAGALKAGDKVGIISQQGGGTATDQADALAHGLVPSLDKLGFTPVASVELPCPEGSQTCAQQTPAIQRMKDAKVKVVFLTASALAGEATVAAAQALDYHPTWVTVGDNVTDTEAQFYKPVAQEYDGAYGLMTEFTPPSPAAARCNAIARRVGVDFASGTDGYSFTAVTCLQVQVLAQAIRSIKGTITQAKLISALAAIHDVPASDGRNGTFSTTKHDAGNFVFVGRYSAATGTFGPLHGRITPVRVP